MITKALLRKRLSLAIGKQLAPSDFTWFFTAFCEKAKRPELRTAKQLDEESLHAFSEFAGYDLRFPIPLPLTTQI